MGKVILTLGRFASMLSCAVLNLGVTGLVTVEQQSVALVFCGAVAIAAAQGLRSRPRTGSAAQVWGEPLLTVVGASCLGVAAALLLRRGVGEETGGLLAAGLALWVVGWVSSRQAAVQAAVAWALAASDQPLRQVEALLQAVPDFPGARARDCRLLADRLRRGEPVDLQAEIISQELALALHVRQQLPQAPLLAAEWETDRGVKQATRLWQTVAQAWIALFVGITSARWFAWIAPLWKEQAEWSERGRESDYLLLQAGRNISAWVAPAGAAAAPMGLLACLVLIALYVRQTPLLRQVWRGWWARSTATDFWLHLAGELIAAGLTAESAFRLIVAGARPMDRALERVRALLDVGVDWCESLRRAQVISSAEAARLRNADRDRHLPEALRGIAARQAHRRLRTWRWIGHVLLLLTVVMGLTTALLAASLLLTVAAARARG